ncbi:alpha/beta hydrolase [Mariniluteicoccus endophyticus]
MSNEIPGTVIGHGPIHVMALHGWFGDEHAWGGLPALVDEERLTYAFLSYRGYGPRRDVAGEHTMAEISADVLAYADQLGWDRFSLVGHSMGGMAIQRVWADAPQRVEALIGVSPVPASGSPFDEDGWALFNGAAHADENRYAIIDFTTGNRNTPTWVNRMVAYSVEHSDREAVGDYLEAWANTSFVDELPQADRPPVTLIVGQHDAALGPETMRQTWLQTYPEARMVTLAEAGHYPMDECPVQFVTALEGALVANRP